MLANLLHQVSMPRVRRTAVPVQFVVDTTAPVVPSVILKYEAADD
ncbi:hypothetical protein [Nocardia abscessus]|nr:hypothetical protein [Nocardia abscessus]